jgi:hypothetical protein
MGRYIGLFLTMLVCLGSVAGTQDTSRQAVQVGAHVKVTVVIKPDPDTGLTQITARFATNDVKAYNINCLSVLRDFKYVLRDTSGQIMVMDETAPKMLLDSATPTWIEPNCERTRPASEKTSFVYLKNLYPKTPSGKYTLEITVAPANLSGVSLNPVQVQL